MTLRLAESTEGPPPSTELPCVPVSPDPDSCPSRPRLISSCIFLRVAELGVKSEAPHLHRHLEPLSIWQGGSPLSCSPRSGGVRKPRGRLRAPRRVFAAPRGVAHVQPRRQRGQSSLPESRSSVPDKLRLQRNGPLVLGWRHRSQPGSVFVSERP